MKKDKWNKVECVLSSHSSFHDTQEKTMKGE